MTTPGGQLTPGDGSTPPVFGVPDGAYVGDASSPNAVQQLSDMTEASAKEQMKAPVKPSFAAQRDGQWGLVQDMIDMMAGQYTGTKPTFVDGQLSINDRLDLLKDNGYCSLTLGSQVIVPTGRDRAVPFNARIGPMNHAEPVTVTRSHPGVSGGTRAEDVIRLDRAGLWQANVAMVQSQRDWKSWAAIVVLRPDLTVYTYLALPTPVGTESGVASGDFPNQQGTPINLFKMFVVDSPGYYVQVRYFCQDGGIYNPRLRGGAQFSQFSVTQWSSDVDATGAPENPSGEIVVS